MNTVLDHLTAALDALDAEIARITEARNDTAALIEQLRPNASAPERPLTSPATGQAARPRADARPRLTAVKPTPARTPTPAKRRPQQERPCPVPGCGRMCGSGPGLAAHLRNAHPDYVTPATPQRPAGGTSTVADVERDLAPL